MNSAGLVTGSPLLAALQVPADPAAAAVEGGDFTAALAAACVAQPETGMPEGMESAAALAWMAGLVSVVTPVQAQPVTAVLQEAGDKPIVDSDPGTTVVPDSALSILQALLAPVVQVVPRGPDVEPSAASVDGETSSPAAMVPAAMPDLVARSTSVVRNFEPVDATGGSRTLLANTVATIATDANTAAVAVAVAADATVAADVTDAAVQVVADRATPVAAPVSLLRPLNTEVQPDVPASVPDDSVFAAILASDSPKSNAAPRDSNVVERLISALGERVSPRAESSSGQVDAERSLMSGANPYASTRETVASAAGAVSSRPEVVHSTVGSPRWANELGSRLAMMSVRGQQEGSLSLTPEHLGPLEVRISVNQDSTNVWFGAQHADTRAALADALPRLREMFAASGLTLGQAGVSQEMPGRESARSDTSALRFAASAETAELQPVAATRISTGLLDAWA